MASDSVRIDGWEAELLEEARVAHLGTVGPHGAPHLVPVCFALVDGRLCIAIDEKPKRGGELARIRNLRRDPRATLLVDRYDEDWTRLAWVRLDCRATIIAAGSDSAAALAALRRRYPQYRTMDLESRPLLELAVERKASWRWGG